MTPSTSVLSKQEIFNRVVNHLRMQDSQSVSFKGNCLYRGAKGCRCAVGALISDSAYSKDLEGQGALQSSVVKALVESNVLSTTEAENPGNPKSKLQMLVVLQSIHDRKYPQNTVLLDKWEPEFRACAAQFNVYYTPPSKED